MIAVLAIARATILEMRRQRLMIVPIIGIVLSLLVLAAVLLLGDGDLGLRDRDAELAALVTGVGAAVAGTIYAIIVGSGLIAREITAGTMLMLAARPIGRWQIIAGRVLGSSVFLLAVLLFVCTSYALVAVLATGSAAPFDEPFLAFAYGAPAIMLGLTFGIACSVRGRATAATGSAIAITLFAWAVGIYAEEWRDEQHQRSFLTEEVRDRLDSDDAIVGPIALGVARALPFWVFTTAAGDKIDIHEQHQYPDGYQRQPNAPVDTTRSDGTGYAYQTAPPPMDAPAEGAPPGTVSDGVTIDTATGLPIDVVDPAATVSPKLPDKPDERAFQCAEYEGARCFLGYRGAWRVETFDRVKPMGEGLSLLLAWLAIPLWMGIAMLLLHRRRDLS